MGTLKTYFESVRGLGVLSTANALGEVNSAVYTKPYFMPDEMIAFVMRHKRTYANLCENPHASFLFKEDGAGYQGKRLNLTKFDESDDEQLIQTILEQASHVKSDRAQMTEKLFIVVFRVNSVLPLIGDGSSQAE